MSRTGGRALPVALVLATALLDRVARGYRAFPSIDDFAYIPLAWAGNDPSLYPRDAILHAFVLHAPLWRVVVGVSERTVGLANGLWGLTLVLTVATVLAMLRLMRALGATGFLLPLAVVLGCLSRMPGVGRGLFDGALGDAFHLQWVALCLLLWTYDAFLRGRGWIAGALLGLAAMSHPAVALHGAMVLALATPFTPGSRWRRLAIAALACALVSAPAVVPLLVHSLRGAGTTAVPLAQVISDYWFRQPNHYGFEQVPAAGALLLLLPALAGVLGTLLLRRLVANAAAAGALGLLAGHTALGVAMVVCYAAPPAGTWRESTLVPYLLDLTRTTPLLVVLGAVAAVAALEVHLDAGAPASDRLHWRMLMLAVGTLVVFAPWRWPEGLTVGLGIAAWTLARRGVRPGVIASALGVVAVLALAWSARHDVRAAPLAAEERELYVWVRDSTPAAGLFIVPPGMQGFRLYGRRSAYVDFKIFPISTPRAVPEWRRRMNEVADPDRRALASAGWEGVPFWDRAYANRNTPSRIAQLLTRTGADYFVWDADGLLIPPFVSLGRSPLGRSPDSRIEIVFRNRRFQVYRRAAGGSDGR